MALPASGGDPAGMSNSNVSRNDRLSTARFRVPVAVTGVALLGLSLLLSVGPALAVRNNSNGNGGNDGGNATNGTVKVHDAATGEETAGNGNEPHVCGFWLSFTLGEPFEAGTWVVVSWAPTGDGSTVASGTYDTAGDGSDSSSVIDLPAGHYRVEWDAAGASVGSKKTFWVDTDCQALTPADESPIEAPASPPDELNSGSPAEEAGSPAEDPGTPSDESPAGGSGSPAEESVVADSPAEDPGTPSDESPAGGSGSPTEESVLADQGSPAEDPGSPVEEPVIEDPGTPSDESAASPAEEAADEESGQATDPSSTDPGTPPMQDQLGTAGTPDKPAMSDTATSTLAVPRGVVATFGLLMLIVAHATARRGKRSDSRA
jgi:hypothetical protein